MTRPYYTLYVRDSKIAPWAPQFGDYSRTTVNEERRDMRFSGGVETMMYNMRVVMTDDNQKAIDEMTAMMNQGEYA